MKHEFMKSLCLAFLMLISVNALADTKVTVGCLKYSLSGSSAAIVGYTEELPTDLVVPETVEYNGLTFDVTAIGGTAFANCSIIETLVVPESVTKIGSGVDIPSIAGAFSNCSNLKNVTLKAVVEIGTWAFYNCSQLRWIDFGNSLSKILDNAFYNCTSLTYLVFPPTISSVELSSYYHGASFGGCDFIQSLIYLGDKVISTGLNNAKTYTKNDFISWDNNNFNYT